MLLEIVLGFIVYTFFRRFFAGDDADFDSKTSDSDAAFSVANRMKKLYDGKVYVNLRIPDSDSGSLQDIDVVVVTKREVVVLSVWNFPGFLSIGTDGSWVCTRKNKTVSHPDPVVKNKRQVAILQSYLEQREVVFPKGYLSGKVILPNPNSCVLDSSDFPPEVITYDQWALHKPEPSNMLTGWIRGTFSGGQKEMQDLVDQKLNYVLSTAPMWDRLELKQNKFILGELVKFQGRQEDISVLGNIKRSKVSRIMIQKSSVFAIAPSKIQVLYSPRDYRSKVGSTSEWKEATVRSSTEVVFQPKNQGRAQKFKLSNIISMTLSA